MGKKTLEETLLLKATIMEMGEKIKWGSDTSQMREAACELKRLRQMIENAPIAIMDKSDVLGICAPKEEDFAALYALKGKRVRLVLDDTKPKNMKKVSVNQDNK